MLQVIRNNTQGIIIWIIIGFVILGLSSFILSSYTVDRTAKPIAEINGTPISENDYQRAFQNYQMRLQQALGQNFRQDLLNEAFIQQTIINGLVERELLHQLLDNAGFAPGVNEIDREIHAIPGLRDAEGGFSSEAYLGMLRRAGLTHDRFRREIAYDIATQQLSEAISNSAFAVTYQANDYLKLEQQQRDIGVRVFAHAPLVSSVEISPDEIQSYYTQHSSEFMTEQKVKVSYVDISVGDVAKQIPVADHELEDFYNKNSALFTREDFAAAETKIKDIERQLKGGASFDALAKQFSDDPGSAKQGGDLGFFNRGMMVKPFEDSVFSLKPGELSKPVRTEFGFHLIKLEEVKSSGERRARHILIKPTKVVTPFAQVKSRVLAELQTQRAGQKFFELADQLDKLSYQHQDSLEPVAEQLGLKINESDFFTRQGGPQIWRNRAAVEAAFSDAVLNQKLNSEIIRLSDDHVLVLRLKEYIPSEIKPLSDVKVQIEQSLRSEKAKQAARAAAQQFYDRLLAGEKPHAAAAANSWQRLGFIGRSVAGDTDPRSKTLVNDELRRHAFRIPLPAAPDKPTIAIEQLMNGDSAVIAVYTVRHAETTDAERQRAVLAQLSQQQGQSDQQSLITYMRKHSEINLNLPKKSQE